MRVCWIVGVAGIIASLPGVGAADPGPWDAERFERKIRPLLAARCWQCHGSEKSKGGLRLDSAAAIEAGGDSGPVVVPGKPGESRLIEAIRYAGELKMPPKGKLSDAEIAELAEWVRTGAIWPDTRIEPARARASCEQRSSLHLRTKGILGLSATARTASARRENARLADVAARSVYSV